MSTEHAPHVGVVTPGNMPRLADLNDDTSLCPAQVGIFCDRCGLEHLDDYLVAADFTREQRFDVAREHMRTLGWLCTAAGDFCTVCTEAGV